VLGLFSSLVPTFLHGVLGVHNLVLVGAASFLIFITAAVSQAVSARLPARRSVSTGVPVLLVCLAALEAALFAKALWVFVIGTVAGGVAVGFIFRGGLSELSRLAAPQHRAAVVSTFFAVAYVGLGLPAVLTGLISVAVGPVDASAYVSGLVAAIVGVAFVVVLRAFGPATTPGTTPVSCDSWCQPGVSAQADGRPAGQRPAR
jgi:predicted MFS family arabinose efflux permease